jgi:prepilin-type N-terminal cleavage/methylation domain-containing protein
MRRRGFTLIEVMVAMVMITVVSGVLALLIRDTLEAQRLQAESFDRLVQSQALADQFRADVGHAEKAPEQWQDHVADASTLILHMKNQDYIVYTWQSGKLDRRLFERGKETTRNLPVGKQVGVEFIRADKTVHLRLARLRENKSVPGQTLEINAALGGDWR